MYTTIARHKRCTIEAINLFFLVFLLVFLFRCVGEWVLFFLSGCNATRCWLRLVCMLPLKHTKWHIRHYKHMYTCTRNLHRNFHIKIRTKWSFQNVCCSRAIRKFTSNVQAKKQQQININKTGEKIRRNQQHVI